MKPGRDADGAVPTGVVSVPTPEALASAREAGLRWVSDAAPGISRVRRGRGFAYRRPDGRLLGDRHALARIRGIVIPPAWTRVWICERADGHIQASGYDARGRKQYRYHPDWRRVRDANKYERLVAFAKRLPALRRRVTRDLARDGLPREKVLATVVRLLELTMIRVGNDEYARTNGSYGLTTLRNRHVAVTAGTLRFRFRGKSGVAREVDVADRHLARIVRRCQDLPGQELFQWVDADGAAHPVDSSDVNAYLREVVGDEFSAKDFRTWAGTVEAARVLAGVLPVPETAAGRKRQVVDTVKAVAKALGNTPAVCRRCYVHPAVLDAYEQGRTLADVSAGPVAGLRRAGLERAVVTMLRQAARSARAAARASA
jgi:DNA topoisomerase I